MSQKQQQSQQRRGGPINKQQNQRPYPPMQQQQRQPPQQTVYQYYPPTPQTHAPVQRMPPQHMHQAPQYIPPTAPRRGGIHTKMRNMQQQVFHSPPQAFHPSQARPIYHQGPTQQAGVLRVPIENRITPPTRNNAVQPSPQKVPLNVEERGRGQFKGQQQVQNSRRPQGQVQVQGQLKTLRLNPNSKRIRKRAPVVEQPVQQNQKQNQGKNTANQQKQQSQSVQKDQVQIASKYQIATQQFLAGMPKIIVQPVSNPTGNPYTALKAFKLPDIQELKGLQVKAELSKLGDAPRSYSELLQASVDNMVLDHEMNEVSQTGRLWISERFEKVEKAKPAVSHQVINLSKKLQDLLPIKSSTNNVSPVKKNSSDGGAVNGKKNQTPQKQQTVARERLQKRAQQTGRGGLRFQKRPQRN